MNGQNFKITIPEPCHEDWNKMLPDAKGKFCNSCNKSVIDFSNKTDTEIRNILVDYKDQKVCGHFKKTQIDRPLNIKIDFKDLPKNVSTTKVFTIALFLVFGTFLFSCTTHKDQKVGEIEVVNTIGGQTMDEVVPLQVMQTETINPISNIYSLQPTIGIRESHVNGGISIQNLPEIEELPVYDSVITENYTVGGMVAIYYPEDTVSVNEIDSSSTISPKEITDKNLFHKKAEFSIYPNPSKGEFNVKYETIKRTDVKVEIYDMSGVLIRSIVDVKGQYQGKYIIPVNLNELPNGMYLVNLIKDEKISTERLIIEK